jgi:hypothetical protein
VKNDVFLVKKISYLGKQAMINEKEIANRLEEGQISLPPAIFQVSDRVTGIGVGRVDAIVWISWGEQREEFAVEFKAMWTPKIIREAMYRVKAAAQDMRLNPMIIVPYLNEERLRELERESVSGVDLCGNGLVIVPDKLFIFRTGNPNQFPSSAPIKNIYRRNTSMVGRVFLVRPRFNQVSEILDEVNQRNLFAGWALQPMSLSTISKALKGLEQDLIVAREGAAARLLQAEKLLDKLVENYTAPKVEEVINWKLPTSLGEEERKEVLVGAFSSKIPAVLTGAASVSRYAVMQAGETLSIYCPDPKGWLSKLPGIPADRFPTLSIIQTEDASVYFDARQDEGLVWASPLQTYLELMAGDKRDQETALQVKDLISRQLGEDRP